MKRPVNKIKLIYFVLGLLISLGSYSKTEINKENFDSERSLINSVNNSNENARSTGLELTTPNIDFDGIDDYIDFGDVHDLTSQFSLEAWVLQEESTATGTIISKGDSKSGNKKGYQLALINNYLNITWYNSSGATIVNLTSPYGLVNNKWYHVATTYDGATAKLYIDGLKVNEVSISSAPLDGTEKFIIGAIYNSDTPLVPKNYFNGFIDEVRVWNVALTTQQIHEMMNQELEQNGTYIRGKVISSNISGNLKWTDLGGYYTMNDNTSIDQSMNNINGIEKNMTTMESQSAPLPYISIDLNSIIALDWDSSATWENGSVNNLPNSVGIDGITLIDWNIVDTKDNIFVSRNLKLLGLKNSSEELSINADYSLEITNYLKLDGKIDLEGQSQMVQGLRSTLDPTSSGTLERDQQGTADTYTYNYWSSPVGLRNTTTNNNNYKVWDIFQGVNFITSGYNGSTSPLGIADYWIWKFGNQTNNISQWQHVRSTGTLKAGEGFTMKGPGTGSISTNQNYVLSGKPNNGIININITAGNDYLVGNPYPCALDANQFIYDNSNDIIGPGSTTGTLYFWDHWSGGSHVLKEFDGGYATYSLSGGSPAASMGTNDPLVGTGGIPAKTPGRYIPVAQGFFVKAETTGTIKFNNGQRVFQMEDETNSVFVKSGNSKNAQSSNNQNIDTREKIRLGFNSVNTIHRQLLATVDPNATIGYDCGYDAENIDNQIDDMYWLIDTNKYTIQGIDTINEQTILPLGIHTKNDGLNTITIDELENVPSNLNIYIHDTALNLYHDLKQSNYDVYLPAGAYLNRFEITFSMNSKQQALSIDDIKNKSLNIFYSNENSSIIIHNPNLKTINSAELFNILGQSIYKFDNIGNENYLVFRTNHFLAGSYIIKLKTSENILTKKVLIN